MDEKRDNLQKPLQDSSKKSKSSQYANFHYDGDDDVFFSTTET